MLNTESQIQYSAILDFIYPVGSYFITESANYDTVEKVQSHFGGTWEQIKDRFLLSAGDTYTNGDTGGSADAVVVSHTHSYKAVTTLSTSHTHNNFQNHQIAVAPDNVYWEGPYQYGIVSTGVDGTGKNMPPYRTVYMYRRTA